MVVAQMDESQADNRDRMPVNEGPDILFQRIGRNGALVLGANVAVYGPIRRLALAGLPRALGVRREMLCCDVKHLRSR